MTNLKLYYYLLRTIEFFADRHWDVAYFFEQHTTWKLFDFWEQAAWKAANGIIFRERLAIEDKINADN